MRDLHLFGVRQQVIIDPAGVVVSTAMIRGYGSVRIQTSSSLRVAPIVPSGWTWPLASITQKLIVFL